MIAAKFFREINTLLMNNKNMLNVDSAADEIDLYEILEALWQRKTFIIGTTLIFLIVGSW